MKNVGHESISLGASFLKVLCQDSSCRDSLGARQLFMEHNGYGSNGGTPVTEEQYKKAETVAGEHNRNHRIRIIEGKL